VVLNALHAAKEYILAAILQHKIGRSQGLRQRETYKWWAICSRSICPSGPSASITPAPAASIHQLNHYRNERYVDLEGGKEKEDNLDQLSWAAEHVHMMPFP